MSGRIYEKLLVARNQLGLDCLLLFTMSTFLALSLTSFLNLYASDFSSLAHTLSFILSILTQVTLVSLLQRYSWYPQPVL